MATEPIDFVRVFGSVSTREFEINLMWISTPAGALVTVLANAKSCLFVDEKSRWVRKEFILNALRSEDSIALMRQQLGLTVEQEKLLDELAQKIEALVEREAYDD